MRDHRAELLGALGALGSAAGSALERDLEAFTTKDASWHVAYPVEELRGPAAIVEGWLAPLARALPGYRRRPEIVMGGASHTGSGHWVALLGHLVGNLEAPLLGIAPHGKLVFLRLGEFYRLDDAGRVTEAYILPDLLDLARQAGRLLVPSLLGTEMLFPSPATHDGVLPGGPERSAAALALVEAMLRDLGPYDAVTFDSPGQSGEGGYWHPDMLWYGPCGIGANVTYPGFQRDHRVPFLTAFPDRQGGNHFARFGDGDYVASGGWPSMTMTHRGPYLGVGATGRAMTLRVMDFWRVADGQIRENWVLLDLPDLLRQMGTPVL